MLEKIWCPDIDAAAAACLAHCPEDTARSLLTAQEVCENRFVFRGHWEMERTHVPVQFDPANGIDWAHIPAGDPEWLYAMNRHACFAELGKAWRYTGEEKYARAFARLLEDWIDRVPLTEESRGSTWRSRGGPPAEPGRTHRAAGEDPRRSLEAGLRSGGRTLGGAVGGPLAKRGEDPWRSLEAGLRCESWLRALKLFAGSPALTGALLRKADACLAQHGEYLAETHRLYHTLSNWGVLQDHGLFLLGLYFDREDWRALALSRLDENLHRAVLRDGTHWEQSPMYHCEVLHCALDTLLTAGQCGVPVPERLKENTHRMCGALAAWLTPAGRLLCQSDSDALDARDLLAEGAVIFLDERLRAAAGERFFEENYWDLGPGREPELASLAPVRPQYASTALPDSGNYLLRAGFGPDAGYLHFHCGCLGSGHGHADLLHIGAGICGEDVLIDSGRYTYVDSPIRAQLKSPAAHNTTRLDGQDFTIYQNSWAYSAIAAPLKGEACFTEYADAVSGMHMGYLDRGVLTGRRVVFLKPLNTAIICDTFAAAGIMSGAAGSAVHEYEANFHLGPGQYTLNHGRLCWQGQRAGALLLNLDEDAACTLGRAPFSREYNRLEEGGLLTVKKRGAGFTGMLHLLSMDPGSPRPAEARRIPVCKAISGEALTDPQAQAIELKKDGQRVVVIFCHAELISEVDLLSAGGFCGYGRLLVFAPWQPDGLCLGW